MMHYLMCNCAIQLDWASSWDFFLFTYINHTAIDLNSTHWTWIGLPSACRQTKKRLYNSDGINFRIANCCAIVLFEIIRHNCSAIHVYSSSNMETGRYVAWQNARLCGWRTEYNRFFFVRDVRLMYREMGIAHTLLDYIILYMRIWYVYVERHICYTWHILLWRCNILFLVYRAACAALTCSIAHLC